MKDYLPLEKFSIMVPDGAAVFGAQQAEAEEGLPVEGSNVAHIFNEKRIERGLPPLSTIHCSGHRGALSDKKSRPELMAEWNNLLVRQWHFFDQSGDAKERFEQILAEMGISEKGAVHGSHQKWVGFAEAEDRDVKQWGAKAKFWESWARRGKHVDQDAKHFAGTCSTFYGSDANKFQCSAMADIQLAQFETNNRLQDVATPVSRQDAIVSSLIGRLYKMAFGSKDRAPELLEPTELPTHHTQRMLKELGKNETDKQLTPEELDATWAKVKQCPAYMHAKQIRNRRRTNSYLLLMEGPPKRKIGKFHAK